MRTFILAASSFLAMSAVAHAQPVDDSGTLPSVLGSKLGLRMPFDVAGGGGYLNIGWMGLGVDLGERTSDRWYFGASGDVEGMQVVAVPTGNVAMDTAKDPGFFGRLRLGGEARYYFDDGVAYASVNDGPEFPVPRHTWISARAGAESYDGGTTIGEFADATLGWDAQLGGTEIGMYGGLAASREPATVFSPTASADTSVMTYGITIGMVLAFGS